MTTPYNDDLAVHPSSGNVFADLGVADAAVEQAKTTLALYLIRHIREQGWTQAQAATALGIDQPKVSRLLRLRLDQFSVNRLLEFLRTLGHDITIQVTEPANTQLPGNLTVASVADALVAD